MKELRRHALHHLTPEPNGELVDRHGVVFDLKKYSKFKYGSGHDAKDYGELLGKSLAEAHPELFTGEMELVIAAAPYRTIPKGAQGITDNLLFYINNAVLLDDQPKAQPIKITSINEASDNNYGSLSVTERQQRIDKVRLQVDREQLEGKQILIVDDCRITGITESKMLRLVDDIDIPLMSVMMLYLAQLDPEKAKADPAIESRMNHAYVQSITQLAEIIDAGNFLMNARVAKFVLSYTDKDELTEFLKNTDEDFLRSLHKGSITDGYSTKANYVDSFALIEEELARRTS